MPNSPFLIAAFAALALVLNACRDTRTTAPTGATPASAAVAAAPASAAPLPRPSPEAAAPQNVPALPAPAHAATSVAVPDRASATPAEDTGKRIYGKYCALCHAAGVAGAPRPGDTAQWAERAARGQHILYERAIAGFKGARGTMPARGGASHLTDDEVRAAVDYMASPSR